MILAIFNGYCACRAIFSTDSAHGAVFIDIFIWPDIRSKVCCCDNAAKPASDTSLGNKTLGQAKCPKPAHKSHMPLGPVAGKGSFSTLGILIKLGP